MARARKNLGRPRAAGLTVLLAVVALAGWGVIRAAAAAPWADESLRYFETLSAAISDDDLYAVLDFYTVDAEIVSRTSDFQDRPVPVSNYLVSHRADLREEMIGVHVGEHGAVILVQWTVDGRLGAVVTAMEDGSVANQTVLVDVDSLSRSLLASPQIVDRYVRLVQDFVSGWSSGESAGAALYARDAEIHDLLSGRRAVGTEQIEEWMAEASNPPLRIAALGSLAESGRAAVTDLAIYLDPTSFGNDPGRAVGIVHADRAGCVEQTAVVWVLDGGRIRTETRYAEVRSHRKCAQRRLPRGWWTGAELPGPRDEVVTGVVVTGEGRRVAVYNGTDRLDDLIEWGLRRFVDAGLAEPRLDSVVFEPSRRCQGVGGRLVVDGADRDLVLCVDEPDVCGLAPDCASPPLAIRSALLHEMGHAWLHDHADGSTRERMLEVAGLQHWGGADLPWSQRGVEYAAEVVAWGLLDEATELQKLGSPPCDELAAALAILTGLETERCGRPAGS